MEGWHGQNPDGKVGVKKAQANTHRVVKKRTLPGRPLRVPEEAQMVFIIKVGDSSGRAECAGGVDVVCM